MIDEFSFLQAEKELQRLRGAVDALIQEGATGTDASDAQKWAVGDLINELSSLAGPALGRARRKSVPPSGMPPQYQQKFHALREEILTRQGVSRNALVD